MFGSFVASGNIVATVVVALTLIASRKWVAPKLTKPVFWTSCIWGLLLLVGQFAQEGGRGSLWVQYHLQDFAYTPWVTTLVICLLSRAAKRLDKGISATKLVVSSAILAFLSGLATEIWDTCCSMSASVSLMSVIDISDYVAIITGAAVTAVLCVFFTKNILDGTES